MQQRTWAHIVLGPLKLFEGAHAAQVVVTDVGIRELSPDPGDQHRQRSAVQLPVLCVYPPAIVLLEIGYCIRIQDTDVLDLHFPVTPQARWCCLFPLGGFA